MSGVAETAVILSLAVVAPIYLICNFILKMRESRGLRVEDERMLSDLWHSAKRMEDRIRTLEHILDTENPNWRNRL